MSDSVVRDASLLLKKLSKQFRAIAIVGPRQSGKTTLAKQIFPKKPYLSFETPSTRNFFESDPNGFLHQHRNGAIFDEAQRVPELFSYLQGVIDESDKRGRFILTGSNNFALQENITQSLAGRIAYIDLLPFSINEIQSQKKLPYKNGAHSFILRGGYPEVATKNVSTQNWFASYIRTYVERDVRQLKSIDNLAKFEKLLLLCAGRTGQLLNMSNLSIEVGVKMDTIQSWLGVLQSSFIIHLLKPYHVNFNKRVVKTPKLYFYDTGLACALLGIHSENDLRFHHMRGGLFENMVINELLKNRFNKGKRSNLFFWRDNTGNELDVIIDNGKQMIPVEIKSGATVTDEFFRGINFWQKISGKKNGIIVYGGNDIQQRSNNVTVMSWKTVGDL